ncbi:MAG TPA: inorganic phosphate transporter [Bacteroidales bacterium]|nr:inorganic phosphate transporter [Bacteroidales bacterium]HPF03798.1 inorganic phosphate transporter [Bacteroidales bacterium]HPJ59640.1 inorganic phosphate transporter [Bacteroidales bacterium]HRW85824.1 inorganic phosphate transporter [Bacteroidales bacterium]
MILFFLTSGLFLGWSLGANDASNIFGSAVGSKMVTFRRAAIIASVFVIVGAVLQGAGGAQTLGKLGAVNAIGGSFTLSLAAAVTVYLMTKFSLPVSTTQAIVGAIIGWNLFTGNRTDAGTLSKIVATWISGPVLGAIFGVLLFTSITAIKKVSRIHIIRFESYIKTGLLLAGALGAYSLGANNIANVMGVFVPAVALEPLIIGPFSLSSAQQLFLLGGLAIATGIITYSKKVMQTVGANIVELSSEAAMVVVLSQSIVLFIFSSSWLSELLAGVGLPAIPLVPVSSSQVIVGSVIGIGLYKGVRNINFRLLGQIAAGWIATPVLSGLFTYFSLFFMKNLFMIDVGHRIEEGLSDSSSATMVPDPETSEMIRYIFLIILSISVIAGIYVLLLQKKRDKELKASEEKFWKNMK